MSLVDSPFLESAQFDDLWAERVLGSDGEHLLSPPGVAIALEDFDWGLLSDVQSLSGEWQSTAAEPGSALHRLTDSVDAIASTSYKASSQAKPRQPRAERLICRPAAGKVRIRPKQTIINLQRAYDQLQQHYKVLMAENKALQAEAALLEDIVVSAGEYLSFIRGFKAQANGMQAWPTVPCVQARTEHASFYAHMLQRVSSFDLRFLRSFTCEELVRLLKDFTSEASMYLLNAEDWKLPGLVDRMAHLQALMIALNLTNPKVLYELESRNWSTGEVGAPEPEHWEKVTSALNISEEGMCKILDGYQLFRRSITRMQESRRVLARDIPLVANSVGGRFLEQLEQAMEGMQLADQIQASMYLEPFLYYWLGKMFFYDLDPLNLLRAVVVSYPFFLSMVAVCEYKLQKLPVCPERQS